MTPLQRSQSAIDERIAELGGAAAVLRGRSNGVVDHPLVRKLDYVTADALNLEDQHFDDELIERTIGSQAVAILYGDSNSGKTFAAIDLGAAVVQESNWLGRSAVGGLVLYLATEAPASVELRVKAYRRHHGVDLRGFVIVRSPINLFDAKADITAVIALIDEIELLYGDTVRLVIGDTLARLAAGANENAGEDMGVVMNNIDAIRAATKAAFLLIHHCGKDAAKGMRGWSGLRAAIDTEIEVTVEEATGIRTAEITKQRDLPGKGERVGFTLQTVHLGVNRWGNDRGSCVVVPTDAPPRRVVQRRSEVAGAIEEFLSQRGTGCLRGALAKHFEGRYVKGSIYREITKMLSAGELIQSAGVVALPGKPGAAN